MFSTILVFKQCLGSISRSVLDPISIKSVDPDMNSDSKGRAAKYCPHKRKNYEISCFRKLSGAIEDSLRIWISVFIC
jgi:hypothetical protein